MASLNLEPNPTILVIQAVVFAAAIFVVKTLFVTPYLRLREARDHQTIDQRKRANDLILQNEEMSSELHARFEKAKDEIHEQVNQIRDEMKQKREEIVLESNKEANQLLDKVRAEIKNVVAEEKGKLSSTIPTLMDQVYQKTIN